MSKYNEFPESWKEISNEEFTRAFFQYCLDALEHRQMMRLPNGEPASRMINANLFSIKKKKKRFPEDGLGVAIFDAPDGTGKWISKYAKFGREEDWSKWQGDFAAQFRGDNS